MYDLVRCILGVLSHAFIGRLRSSGDVLPFLATYWVIVCGTLYGIWFSVEVCVYFPLQVCHTIFWFVAAIIAYAPMYDILGDICHLRDHWCGYSYFSLTRTTLCLFCGFFRLLVGVSFPFYFPISALGVSCLYF